MAVVLAAFLIIGLALPVLPQHVHQGLGLDTFVVGLITGSQFAASLISRLWSGHYADSRGAKRAVVAGLLMATGAGLLYVALARLCRHPGRVGHHPVAGPSPARRGGEFHHHGSNRLGSRGRRPPAHRQGHRLGRHRDVGRLCARRSGRQQPSTRAMVSLRSRLATTLIPLPPCHLCMSLRPVMPQHRGSALPS